MLPFPFQASMLLHRLLTSSARVLIECGVQAVKTNIPFLFNVLNHPEFDTGIVTMAFINKNLQLKRVSKSLWDFVSDKQSIQRKVNELEQYASFTNAALSNAFLVEM